MSNQDPNDEKNPTDAEVTAMKEQAMRTLLAPEARLRLNNVRLVKPDLAGYGRELSSRYGISGKTA